VFKNKLGLTNDQAITFARFLIEEPDENKPDAKIDYNPSKRINFQHIIVKLMTNSNYPIIYRENHE